MALNTIHVSFDGQNETITKKRYQYDKGQVCVFDDIELPEAYKVIFSNNLTGENSIPMIGDENGVKVPDNFFLTGLTIYGWVYLSEGDDDGQTVKHFTVPVEKRVRETDEEPTPEEQTEIEQVIAALNSAVESAETAIEHYPKIVGGYWYVWDVETETWVDTGAKAQGEQGIPGQPGTPGQPGANGYSPQVTIQDITGGHRVTITDTDGEHVFDVMNGEPGQPGQPGQKGDDGYSPQVTIQDITNGHRVTITDKTGAHTFDVMDGAKGDPGQGVPAGGATGQVLRKQGNDDFIANWSDETVKDVQINGTTILLQGVANIPLASSSVLGLVKAISMEGLYIKSDGSIIVNKADSASVKAGTAERLPIVPSTQHESAFYGMAKAAGDSTQSASANAVGTYTEGAKSSISDMLNAPENKSGTTVSITAKSGIRYKCGEVATLDIVVPASGLFEVDFESGSTATVLTTTGATVTWPLWFDPTSLDSDTLYEISIQDGKGLVASWPA